MSMEIGGVFQPLAGQAAGIYESAGAALQATLPEGETVEATVLYVSDTSANIKLEDGSVVKAQLSGDVPLTEGQTARFAVSSDPETGTVYLQMLGKDDIRGSSADGTQPRTATGTVVITGGSEQSAAAEPAHTLPDSPALRTLTPEARSFAEANRLEITPQRAEIITQLGKSEFSMGEGLAELADMLAVMAQDESASAAAGEKTTAQMAKGLLTQIMRSLGVERPAEQLEIQPGQTQAEQAAMEQDGVPFAARESAEETVLRQNSGAGTFTAQAGDALEQGAVRGEVLLAMAGDKLTRPEKSEDAKPGTFYAAAESGEGESLKGPSETVNSERASVAAPQSETAPVAARQGETAPIAAPQSEAAPIAAPQSETAPIAATQGETAPIAATQSEAAPIAAPQGETAPVAAPHGETAPVAAPQGETAPVAAPQSETAPIAATQGETAPIAATQGEATPMAAPQGETAPIAAPQGEAAPIAAPRSETAPIAATQNEAAQSAQSAGLEYAAETIRDVHSSGGYAALHSAAETGGLKADALSREVIKKLFALIAEGDPEGNAERLHEAGDKLIERLVALKTHLETVESSAGRQMLHQVDRLIEGAKLFREITQFAYCQIPVAMNDDRHTAEMYVFKRGGGAKKIDMNDVSVLVALDTAQMGRVESFLHVKNKSVSTKFRVAESEATDFISERSPELFGLLGQIGYKLADMRVERLDEEVTPIVAEREHQRFMHTARVDLHI